MTVLSLLWLSFGACVVDAVRRDYKIKLSWWWSPAWPIVILFAVFRVYGE